MVCAHFVKRKLMLVPQITECQNCQGLKQLLVKIDCSLNNFGRNKLNSENYNVETYYCKKTVKALSHYKRILSKRIYNPTYISCIDNQDLIFQVRRILFGDCPKCITCEDDTTSTTTNTSSTTFTSTVTTTNID